MRRVPLTQGQFAIVDDVDYDAVSAFSWQASFQCHTWYARTKVRDGAKRKTVYMHGFILDRSGISHPHNVDHINGDGLDNRRNNLRPATVSRNQLNATNTKGIRAGRGKGVFWNKRANKWEVAIGITVEGKKAKKYIGVFETLEEANAASNNFRDAYVK